MEFKTLVVILCNRACLSLSTTWSETPLNKFLHDQTNFFWSLGRTAATSKAYIETINFDTLNYMYLKPLHILSWKTMCGTQQLQCKSESAPQIIGAHEPHQACNEYTHVHCFESTVTTGGRGGTAVRTAEPPYQNPVAKGLGLSC